MVYDWGRNDFRPHFFRCLSPGWDGTRDHASDRSRNASRRSQNGSNNTVIAAGGTGTLPKLVANASLVHKAVYYSTSCYGSGYFRHCATTMFLIEDTRWP